MNTECVTVRLLFFAKSRDLSGIGETTAQVPVRAKVSELLDSISKQYNLDIIKNHVILAINEEYCDNLEEIVSLKSGDEIAVIPPLSGG